ncbi:MAG: QueG-associated DUF1730 domain-containing protein [bacterium]
MALQITGSALQDHFREHCPRRGIDLAGAVALPCPLPHEQSWLDWIAAGRHAGLEYLTRDPAGRADPTSKYAWARSVLVFAQRYTTGWASADEIATQDSSLPDWQRGVSRYARGVDYHDRLLTDVREVLAPLAKRFAALQIHPAVDTGPFLEREYAWLAGLGFWGQNCCLIHERLGSGLFLAVVLTNLEISDLPRPGEPAAEPLWGIVPRTSVVNSDLPAVASRCGTCRRCLEACPTAALSAPYRLDAGRCLATWTIEWQGRAPVAERARQGEQLFGCDICQAVCPWNRKAWRKRDSVPAGVAGREVPSPLEAYAPLPAHADLDLSDLLTMDPEEFRRRFRRTPLWRAHPEGMRRNAMTVAANTARVDLVEQLVTASENDPDPEVRQLARWALARLREDR